MKRPPLRRMARRAISLVDRAIVEMRKPRGAYCPAGEYPTDAERNSAWALGEYAHNVPYVRTTPSELIFDLTNACAIRCRHCFRTHASFRPSFRPSFIPPTVLTRMPQRFLDNARQVDLSGMGEPMLHPRWDDILELAADGGQRYVTFNTSLTRVKEARLKRMVELGCGVSVSIDGVRKETFEYIRAGASHEDVFGSLRLLSESARQRGAHPRFNLGVKWVLYKGNLAELREMAEMAGDLGIPVIRVQPLAPLSPEMKEMCCDPLDPLTEEHLAKAFEEATAQKVCLYIHEHLVATEVLQRAAAENNALPLRAPFQTWHHHPDAKGCSFPWTQLKVDSAGYVVACCFSDHVMANAVTGNFERIWNNPLFARLRREVNLNKPAVACVDSPSGGVCCPRVQYLKSNGATSHFLQ